MEEKGMEKCEICGQEKQMYYQPWCAKCEKPTIQLRRTLNFLQCLEHLEANGHQGIKERVWNYYADLGYFQNNTTFTLHFPEAGDDRDGLPVFLLADLDLIKETWGIEEDHVEMEVSW